MKVFVIFDDLIFEKGNDSRQDALQFEYRIGVQIYKLVRFCISDTFGNPLTPNETMWWYNLLITKKTNSK